MIQVHFYGGHVDGLVREFEGPAPQSLKVALPGGARQPEAGPFTLYRSSAAWSNHFEGRWTMIPAGFPGKPPREKAAA